MMMIFNINCYLFVTISYQNIDFALFIEFDWTGLFHSIGICKPLLFSTILINLIYSQLPQMQSLPAVREVQLIFIVQESMIGKHDIQFYEQ